MSKIYEMEGILHRLVEWMPILAVTGAAIGRLWIWITHLKTDVKDAHDKIHIIHTRLAEIEARQIRFEDKIDIALLEINRRIDDCKKSVLENIQIVLQAVTKT